MKKILLLSLFLMLTLLNAAMAQDRTISGTVLDKGTNTGLPGVTVSVKGMPGIGTNTDLNGAFTMSVPAGATTLEFSFIGYRKVERTIGSESTFNVTLETDTKQLGEVVVTALGLEKEKRTLGYSTQELNSQEITQGRDRSVINSMQGKVAGVQISSASGGVGSSTRVVIRGNKSLQGDNQPLYVIDGIPINNSSFTTGDNLNNSVDAGNRANDINPEDVESINILKGPAAVALYGSRAANGAIIITTKNGKGAAARGKKAEITYSTSYMFESVLRYPKVQNEFGQGFFGAEDLLENTSWGPRFDDVVRPWGHIVDGQQKIKPYSALPNNMKEFFETGSQFSNTVSLGGGDAKTDYYFSLSNTAQKGIVPTTEYDRSSVMFSGGTKLTNKFSSRASATYTKSGGDLAVQGQGNSFFNQIIQTPRDIPTLELRDLDDKFNNVENFYSPYTVNPYWALENQSFRNDVDRLIGNVQLGYEFNDNFSVMYRIGTDLYSDRRKQFRAIRAAVGGNAAQNDPGRIVEDRRFIKEVNSDLIGTFKKDFTEDLNFSLMVGHNVNQRSTDFLRGQANAIGSNEFQGLDNVIGNYDVQAATSLRRLHGVYGTTDITFRNYLTLSLSARNDWSSTLPKENNSFFYPAASLSFVFSDLLGVDDNSIISYGKFRANIARVGNDADPYQIDPVFVKAEINDGFDAGVTALKFPFQGQSAFSLSNRIANPNLTPEITKSWEVGTDLRFFADRLNLDLTYYNSESTEQIVNVPVAYSTGFSSFTLNAGTISNKGIEVLLSGSPIRTNDFDWNIAVNYTKNKNRVEDLFGDTEQISLGGLTSATLVARVGQPYGEFQAEAYLLSPQGQIVVGADGRPRVAGENKYVGNIQPDYIAGLTNTFTYKGLRFSVVFDTKQGGKFYSRTRSTMRFAGTAPETLYNDRQPFIIPNSVVETNGEYSPNTTPITNNTLYSYWGNLPEETNIIDASYVKLRELSLTYSLPTGLIDGTPFGNIEIGVSGRNLLLWTPDENTYVDPEVNTFGNGNLQGFDFSGSPSTRSYGANLRVTF